jgi:hypothetical protein
MSTDESFIGKAKTKIESSMGWGDSDHWTNQDFLTLSEKIREQTGVTLSHVTLKRIWGKVKYDSLPNPHTLDTLARFAGYENWRDLKGKNGNGHTTVPVEAPDPQSPHPAHSSLRPRKRLLLTGIVLSVVAVLVCIIALRPKKTQTLNNIDLNPADYSFSSKKVVSTGIPNSVIFDYDATHAPGDSVIIQQSWDKNLRMKVAKAVHQHTAIYYYPDFYYAKLIVGGRIVRQHELFIQTDGWLPMVVQSPIPVYFKKEDAIANGRMGLSPAQLEAKNIHLQPKPVNVLYANVRDFGEIYSDDFVFETSLKNDYAEGASVCQPTKVYLLCQGTAIWMPLCAKGCVSDADLLFTGAYASGKQQDLSAFGVDFSRFVKLRIESQKGAARVLINDKTAYTLDHGISHSKIIGIEFQFQGGGTVDYVRLSGGKSHYDDEF